MHGDEGGLRVGSHFCKCYNSALLVYNCDLARHLSLPCVCVESFFFVLFQL